MIRARVPLYLPARLRRRPAPTPPAPPAPLAPIQPPAAPPASSRPGPRHVPTPRAQTLPPPRREARHAIPTDQPTGRLAGMSIAAMSAEQLADRDDGPHRTMLRREDAVLTRLAKAGGGLAAHQQVHPKGSR